LGVPKPTEMTIRNFLLKELEKRGVKVDTEVTYTTPIGRLMPDMLLHNGAQYVVETKLGAEAKLLDAMVRLYDYSKYTQAKGAFAVLFPQELRQPWNIEILEKIARDPKLEYVATATFKDLRPSQRFAGNLSQMADWMAAQVLRPLVVEADTSFAIKVLTEAVESLSANVRRLRGKELEDIFGGKTVFENILQYEEGRYPLEEMRQAATYLLINQIIFYHVLSRMDVTFEAIDEDRIGKPSDLLRYFRPVLERDYSSVFGFDVASRLPESATKIVKTVIMTIKALAPEKIGQDVLGKVFHELIPFNIRKAVAAFYTNNEAAEILAQLAIEKPDAKVMDLAVGSGTLLVAAYRRKRELLQKFKGTIELEDHKQFLEQDLTGVDIMPFAAHLAVMHLSLQALLHETEKVRVAVWDSTDLKPDMNIPAIQNELKAAYRKPTLDMYREGAIGLRKEAYIKKGAITLEGVGGEEIPLEKADVVIMNPPFTRQERLPKEYKEILFKRLSEYKDQLHGQLGLWGYFLLLADRFVKQGGRIALVYPSRPLGAASAKEIRRFLLDKYNIEYVITSWKKSAFSESTQYREVLLIMKKVDGKKEGARAFCKVVNLKSLPQDLREARSFAEEIKGITSEYDSERIRATVLDQKELEETIDNWFIHIASFDPRIAKRWVIIRSQAAKGLLSFKDYLMKRNLDIVRGVETKRVFGFPFYEAFIVREPKRALKSYDLWFSDKLDGRKVVVRNRFSGESVEIPRKKLCHGIRRASGMETLDLSDIQDYIIIENFEGMEKILSKSSAKFQKKSKAWKKYVKSRFGRFLMSRRFNLSAKGTKLLAFYSDKPTTGQNLWSLKDVDEDEAMILTLWFNSTLNLLQVYLQRVETEGAWMEINKGMIHDFLVVSLNSLNKNEKNRLLGLFKEVHKIKFPSIIEQLKTKFEARVKIDKVFLEIFGFKDSEIHEILDFLYPALTNEIEQLKTLMAG
jgi:type I restriction-modification system DNA methylase subunit